jgi:poly(3-hydroxybutyrate) depolymerase
MITKLGLSLALFTLAGLLSGPAEACFNPINPTFSRSTIDTVDFHREFIVSGCADDIPRGGLPIIFGFHGGGERLHDESGSGFLDFTNLSALHALVIVPVGNVSNNGHSWINAFPWMKPNPENDLALPAALIDWMAHRRDLPRTNLSRVYVLGKSDGAGMSMALACNRDRRVNLAGVALVSGAYFGLESATNFGRNDHEICLPEFPVPMIVMHGTADEVMRYAGQNFRNAKALEHATDYWTSIDPTAGGGSSSTYTAGIAPYVEALSSEVFHCAGFDESPIGSATTLAVGTGCDAPFQILTIMGGNHVWPGHAMSGPGSGQYPNMDFDATAEIARFFSIPMSVIRRVPHDFNGDGFSDVAWRDTSGNIAIWLMNGTEVLNQNSSFVAGVTGQWAIVGQRDFNGDGKADLLWHDTSGNVAIWEMNGTTVVNASSSFVATVPTSWSILGTGDFNADGMGDLLWLDASGNVAIWEMNGTMVLNQNNSFVANVPGQWAIKGTGDFNGDGKADILWQDTSGNVAIWEMNGTAILNPNSSFVANVSGQWSIRGTGDFNGDGMADILWQDASGNVAIWEMSGTTVLNPDNSFVANVPSQWSIQLTGDYNSDGRSDILWQDTSGNVAMWEMNGTTILNADTSFVSNVSGQWSIQYLGAD